MSEEEVHPNHEDNVKRSDKSAPIPNNTHLTIRCRNPFKSEGGIIVPQGEVNEVKDGRVVQVNKYTEGQGVRIGDHAFFPGGCTMGLVFPITDTAEVYLVIPYGNIACWFPEDWDDDSETPSKK